MERYYSCQIKFPDDEDFDPENPFVFLNESEGEIKERMWKYSTLGQLHQAAGDVVKHRLSLPELRKILKTIKK